MALKRIIASLFRASAPVSVTEKIVSAAAAFLGIFLTALLSSGLGDKATPLMITSLGASSVLLFAASHSPMAQPWPFVGGQLISALVGVHASNSFPAYSCPRRWPWPWPRWGSMSSCCWSSRL